MVATFYYPGTQRLADGSIPSHVSNYCAMKNEPLGSTVRVRWHGHDYILTVRDRSGRDCVDMPSREFKERFGRAGVRKGRIPVEVQILHCGRLRAKHRHKRHHVLERNN